MTSAQSRGLTQARYDAFDAAGRSGMALYAADDVEHRARQSGARPGRAALRACRGNAACRLRQVGR